MLVRFLQGLYEGEISDFTDRDYELCLNEMKEHAVYNQVYHLLQSCSLPHPAPEQIMSTLYHHYMRTLGQNLFVRHHEDLILRAFEAAQIEVIPLKGTRFAERFFGSIGARPTSDIDLLIRPEDIKRVCQLLQSLGYSEPEPFNPRHYHCMVRKQTSRGELIVEIHWSMVKQYTSNMNARCAWENSQTIDSFRYIRELSVPYSFYSTCLHGANHKMASLKLYLDITQLLYVHADDISYAWLAEQATRDMTFRRVGMVLTTVYQMFPKLHRVKSLGPFGTAKGQRGRFGLSQYDSLMYRCLVVKDWLWPRSDVARWFLHMPHEVPGYTLYLVLYYRRLRKTIQLLTRWRAAQPLHSTSSEPDQTT